MPNILHIETSTEVCSVALSCDGYVQFHREAFDGPSHASLLGGFVQDAVTYARLKELPLHAVAVSGGPGSYTGLRIGVSEAKGLCFGLGLPLIAVNTLELLCTTAMFRADAEPEANMPHDRRPSHGGVCCRVRRAFATCNAGGGIRGRRAHIRRHSRTAQSGILRQRRGQMQERYTTSQCAFCRRYLSACLGYGSACRTGFRARRLL